MKKHSLLLLFAILVSCAEQPSSQNEAQQQVSKDFHIENTSMVVLGTIQDAGSPHIACTRECCADLFETPSIQRQVVSLGLIDAENNKTIFIHFNHTNPVINPESKEAQLVIRKGFRTATINDIFEL